MRAAIYCRFSTDRQTESTIQDQIRVCTEAAERNGMQVLHSFEDRGISGAAVGNRPGFQAMMASARARDFDALLVMDLSRLSRSQADLAKAIDRLTFVGIRVIAPQDGFDTTRDGHELVSGLSGIIGQQFRKMIAGKTRSALHSRAITMRASGGRSYGYRPAIRADGSKWMEVVNSEAEIVREIFQRSCDGESCGAIAAALNQRGVPSPGASWARTIRRARGWAGSAVRVILMNPKYAGRVIWNASTWSKDPDTGMRRRLARPKQDHIEQFDEKLKIVSDETWERAQRRGRAHCANAKTHTAGKPRYVLSGLLRCGICGGSFVLSSKDGYSCAAYHGGKACPNSHYVPRHLAEEKILGDIFQSLLSPDRVARMASEMQKHYRRRLREHQERTDHVPEELKAMDDRISRLRKRLQVGDPDLTGSEIQAAIDRAQAERAHVAREGTVPSDPTEALALLPRAADLYREQIEAGLGHDAGRAQKGRGIVRRLLEGPVELVPQNDGTLWANFAFQPAKLLVAGDKMGNAPLGIVGSGGRI